jgi:uncharacterized protein with beta-barrel porin domain
MPAFKVLARRRSDYSICQAQKGLARLRISVIIVLVNCIFARASATELNSSQTGYVLNPADNPFTVVAGATIDTSAHNDVAIFGDTDKAGAWKLINNGNVNSGYFGVQFDSTAVFVNNGKVISGTTTSVALYSGGNVINSAGALIAGQFDGVFANNPGSSVTNAGIIGGSASDIVQTQSAIHLPKGGTVTNLVTGRIAAYGPGILANSATTIQNAGLISSLNGTAIDLSVGETSMSSVVSNSGTIIGQGGTAIRFGPGDNTLMLAGTSVITGIVDATAHGASAIDTLILGGTSAGNFDLSSLGATAQYRGFDTLRKNDSGVWTLTGISNANQTWLVSGGGIAMAGQLNGNLVVTPGATGIDIDVLSDGSIRASSASAVSLNGASRLVNSGSIISNADGVPAVASSGAGTSVVNTGSIAAQGRNGAGVAMDALGGAASLTNLQGGSITSATGVAVSAGSNVSILNAGMLAGTGAAIRFTGANDRLTLDTGSNLTGDLDGGNGAANELVLQGSGTLTSRTYGFSTLTMQGTDWTLAGSVETSSASTIGSGTVRLTGTLTSPEITVALNAVLTGTGTLQGALALQGAIAPGATNPASARGLQPLITGTLSVAGSYRQAANSLYEAAVTPQGNDLISVAGKATLGGGTVQALVRADSFMVDKTYEILSTTDGLTGTFAGVTTLNPFISPSLVYDANNAYLHVQGNFQFAGGTPNQIAVEAALDHGVAGIRAGVTPTRDFLGVVGNLLNLEGSSAYAALDQLSAEAYAAFADAHFEAARLGLDAIDSRLFDARATGECAAGEGAPSSASNARACSWVSLLGSTGRTGGYDTWLGQQTGLAGVISGLDYRVVPQVMVGAALAYVRGNTSTDTLPIHGQFDSYQATLYGSYVPGFYWLQASLGYARNDDEMQRSLFFTDSPRTALGEADGDQYFVSLRNGVDVSAGKYGVFSPFVALELQRAQSPAFIESGADSVDLAVSGNAENSVRSLLGAQWRNGFDWLGHVWSLGVEFAWVHQYGSLTRTIDASFEGAPGSGFTEHGSGPAGDAAQIGIGTRVALGKRMHAFVRYDGEFGGRGHSNAGNAGFDYRW